MKTYYESAWWMFLLAGLFLLLFGVFAVAWPGLTVYAFTFGVAIYFIASGVINLISSVAGIGRLPLWFLSMVLSAVEIGVGVYALKNLTMAAATLVLLLGLVLLVRGVVQIVSAFGDGYEGKHRSLTAIVGILGVIAGIAIWIYPVSGALAAAWVAGLYGILSGGMMIALALEARVGSTTTARA